MPICNDCKQELNDSNWFPSLKSKNSKVCKTCNNKRGNTWKRNHPEAGRNYSKRYYETHPQYNLQWTRQNRLFIRKEMIAAYGGKCAVCGNSNPIVLDIDHIDNNGASDRKKGMWGWRMYRWLKRNEYPKDNFQLLCRNCNWIKHIESKQIAYEIIKAIVEIDSNLSI